MHNSVLEINGDIFTELERIQLEHAMLEEHTGEVCIFCGDGNEVSMIEMRSFALEDGIELPVCGTCSVRSEGKKIEQFLIEVEMADPSHWSRIIINNMRKTDWISKIVFQQLLGGIKGRT
jgi:hypothetical protein